MTGLRYAANVVTDTREYSPEEIARIQERLKKSPVESTIKMERLLWMDDTKVPGSSLYMECVWLWSGETTSGTMEEPHVHAFDEVIGFISSDPDNPSDLDAKMEINLGDETHFLTKSCLVYIPAGMKHCPLTFRKVNRPVFFFTLAPISRYGRTSEDMKSNAPNVPAPLFSPPLPDASGTRYGRFIITKPKPHAPPPIGDKIPSKPTAKATQIVSLDNEAIPGAFYVDFVWIWSGTMTMAPEAHVHDFDEMIGFITSATPNHARAIEGDITIALEGEKYPITQSSLVLVPSGVSHCPIEFKDIKRPVLIFTAGNARMWGKI
jgi:hypothetical protein